MMAGLRSLRATAFSSTGIASSGWPFAIIANPRNQFVTASFHSRSYEEAIRELRSDLAVHPDELACLRPRHHSIATPADKHQPAGHAPEQALGSIPVPCGPH